MFKFLQTQQQRCHDIAPSKEFKFYMSLLLDQEGQHSVQTNLYHCLALLCAPQNLNPYKFLVEVNKHDIQRIYELDNLSHRIKATNDVFTSFVKKLELWTNLEQNYDIKQDQQKTQKKLEEIYESLK